ncbi:MAG: type II toxin-antitoxin system HicA family toxin [Gemmataceae bacterium]
MNIEVRYPVWNEGESDPDGWFRVKARGGHRQFKHPAKKGRVTVSGKASDDLPPGTLNSILKQAGLES